MASPAPRGLRRGGRGTVLRARAGGAPSRLNSSTAGPGASRAAKPSAVLPHQHGAALLCPRGPGPLPCPFFSAAVLAPGADPVPPCPAPFPHTAVGETWCSTPLASNAASGVQVAQYGFPAGSTLVTAATDPSLWYFNNFYLGGGVGDVLEYLATAKAIQNGRTVPFVIRPQSPLASPAGWWLTSLLVSPANYPSAASTLPKPAAANVVLEPLGSHAFATLDFYSSSCPPLYEPPYFTDFQYCDAALAAGLPAGWVLKTDSVWTPSWLLFNGANYNGTWTNRCMAEVVKAPASAPAAVAPLPPAPAAAPPPAPARALRPLPPLPPAAATTMTAAAAPPICALMLEFETVYWGAWAPPHAPNTEVDIDGGSDGLHAKDDAAGVIVYGTSTDTPFFGLRLATITVATGKIANASAPWPYAPPGFPGVYGYFRAVEHSAALGFVVLTTEISKFGLLPTRSRLPGYPLGWTVVSTLDPFTGNTSALTGDLTPALQAFPPLVGGPSALDEARSVLWLLSAEDGADPLGPQGCPAHPASPAGAQGRVRGRRRAERKRLGGSDSGSGSGLLRSAGAAPPAAFFLGVQLTRAAHAPPPAAAAAPIAISILTAGGSVVTAYEYASAVDCIVALSYNITGAHPPPAFGYVPAVVTLYPVNGSAPVVIGGFPGGTYSALESVGTSAVSADGRFVYFGAVQPSNTFESAALITVDTLARTLQTVNAAPTNDYDVFNLFKC